MLLRVVCKKFTGVSEVTLQNFRELSPFPGSVLEDKQEQVLRDVGIFLFRHSVTRKRLGNELYLSISFQALAIYVLSTSRRPRFT